MSRTLHFVRPSLRTLLPLLLLVAVGLSACKDDEHVEGTFDETLGYKVGTPITDSTVAAIAFSADRSDTLTVEELESRFRNFAQVFPQIMFDPEQAKMVRKDIVEDFVNVHVLRTEADRQNVQADTLQVAAQLAQFRSDSASYAFLLAQGVTEAEVRRRLEENSRLQRLAEQITRSTAPPTPQEVDSFRTEQSLRVNAQHILFRVPAGASPADEAQVRARAQAVLDSIKAGAEFAALAARHSDDPGSAAQGGSLGFFGRGELVPEFENVAFGLQNNGDLAPELVKTQYGFHIIRLLEKQAGEPIDPQTAQGALLEKRKQEAVIGEVERLKKDVTVRLNRQVLGLDEEPQQAPPSSPQPIEEPAS